MEDPIDVCQSLVRPRPERPIRARAFGAMLLVLLAACSPLKPRPDLPPESALPPAAATALDAPSRARENAHPGASGFRLVADNMEAFALRLVSTRLAGRSLDVQTYIWHADLTGGALAHALLAAADRGVRVRLLVDDMDARAKNAGFTAIAAHPNIQVRLFNPFASRSGFLSYAGRGAGQLRAASTTGCTTRAGSPTTAWRSSAAATSATSTSAPPRR